MKKVISLTISVLIITSLLFGCSIKESSNRSPDSWFSSSSNTNTINIGEIKQVSSHTGADLSVTSEKGFYQMRTIFPDGFSILFTDYETNRMQFLCANPECTHDRETCQSFVDTSLGNIPGLAFVNHKLLSISPASVDARFNPKIEIMDEDGSNRRVLAYFKPSQNIGTGQFCADDAYLYFIMEDFQFDGSYTRALARVNLETGEFQKITDCGPDDKLIGGYGHCLYIDRTIQKRKIDPEDYKSEEEFQAAVDKSFVAYLEVVDLETQEWKTVKEWNPSAVTMRMIDTNIYYYNSDHDTFTRYSLKDQSESTVPNTTGDPLLFPNMQGVIDNKLIVGAIIDNDPDTPVRSSFSVDFDDPSIEEIGLLNNWGQPIYLCGEFDGKVFVEYQIEETSEMIDDYGTPIEIPDLIIFNTKIAYLTLEDFFSGKGNYVATEGIPKEIMISQGGIYHEKEAFRTISPNSCRSLYDSLLRLCGRK